MVLALLVSSLLTACGTQSTYERSTSRASAPAKLLAKRCWPLPETVHFDFGYQVVGHYVSAERMRWVLDLQWDRLTSDEVATHLADSLTAAGFSSTSSREGWDLFHMNGFGDVGVRVIPLSDSNGAVVQGRVLVDLPLTAVRARRGGCTPIPTVNPPVSPATVLGDQS